MALAADFTLVGDGTAAKVVIPANAEESTKLAAAEFTNYVAKATGVALEVEVGGRGRQWNRSPSVIVGTLNTLEGVPEEVRAKLAAAKSFESSVTYEKDGVFWIVGKEETGELYGVYRLLEDQLGVRWFIPPTKDDPGDFVPKADRIVLSGALKFRAPFFPNRRLDLTGAYGSHIPVRGVEWAYRLGLQVGQAGGAELLSGPDPRTIPGKRATEFEKRAWDTYKPRTNMRTLAIGGSHGTFYEAVPAKTYFKDHPEYFSEVDGRRVPGLRYCLSNTNVQHLVAEDIKRRLRASGGRGRYVFGLMDGIDNVCECKACQAQDDAGAKNRRLNADITTRFCRAVMNIANEVYGEFPTTDALNVWAYSNYGVTPPTELKMDPRMTGFFCIHGRCYGHRLDDPDCPCNVNRYAWLRDWMKVYTSGYCYEYGHCSANFYTPYELTCASDLKLYSRIGITGWKEEMFFSDALAATKDREHARHLAVKQASNWQWYYMVSRLTWDPALDPQAVLDEIESKYYQEAYPAMGRYHALRRELWRKGKACMGYPRSNPRVPELLNDTAAKAELFRLLDEADALAKDPVVRVRVANDRAWLTEFWVKPNEAMRAKERKALKVRFVDVLPALDGDGSDAAWAQAHVTDDYRQSYSRDHAPFAPELRTTGAVMADADNLYFRFVCGEPNPDGIKAKATSGGAICSDDSVEIMLFPPSEANTYVQIAANSTGHVVVYEHPKEPPRPRPDIHVEAAAKVGRRTWTVELKVPVAKIFPLNAGDTWRVLFARNRQVRDAFTSKESNCWSLDGGQFHRPSDFMPMHIGAAEEARTAPDARDLFPFVIRPDAEGTAMDMSAFVPAPAGRDGFIRREGEHLVDGKGRLVRLNGVNLTGSANFPAHAEADRLAAHFARLGINCVRLHYFDTTTFANFMQEPFHCILRPDGSGRQVIDEEKRDRLEYMIAAFKRRGVHVSMNIHAGRCLGPADGVPKTPRMNRGVDFFDPKLIAEEKAFMRDILRHVNPYTGLALADDPAMAILEINNENALFNVWWANTLVVQKADPYYAEEFHRLREAAGYANTRDGINRFIFETERRYFRTMIGYARQELGVKCPCVGTQQDYTTPWVMAETCDVMDSHIYWEHPGWTIPPDVKAEGRTPGIEWRFRNCSIVDSLDCVTDWGNIVVMRGSRRMKGMPFITSECAAPYPCWYGAEYQPFIHAYAAFQDWAGVFAYTWNNETNAFPDSNGWFFSHAARADCVAHFPASAAIFLRRDVAPARVRLDVPADFEYLAEKSVREERDRPLVVVNPRECSANPVRLSVFAEHAIGVDLHPQPGAKNPPVAPRAPDDTAFVSDTGEIRWDPTTTSDGVFVVDAPNVKVLTGHTDGRRFDLGGIVLEPGRTKLGWSAVSLVSQTANGFGPGARILLAATGYTQNGGAVFRHRKGIEWGGVTEDFGSGKMVTEGVPLTVTLPCGAARCWALDERGARAAEVPVDVRGGKAVVAVGAKYGTVWYEIASGGEGK